MVHQGPIETEPSGIVETSAPPDETAASSLCAGARLAEQVLNSLPVSSTGGESPQFSLSNTTSGNWHSAAPDENGADLTEDSPAVPHDPSTCSEPLLAAPTTFSIPFTANTSSMSAFWFPIVAFTLSLFDFDCTPRTFLSRFGPSRLTGPSSIDESSTCFQGLATFFCRAYAIQRNSGRVDVLSSVATRLCLPKRPVAPASPT